MKGKTCAALFGVLLMISVSMPLLSRAGGGDVAKFDEQGALLLPEGYRGWIFVGSTVTPNDMNGGNAAFPEFHNIYMDPESFRKYEKTGRFPEGAVLVKETVSVGSKQASSGNGYFMGKFVGLFAVVKDSKRFPEEPEGWAFFTFKESAGETPKTRAEAHPTASCSVCHQGGSQERIFKQYYPVLNELKPD
ncbi:MAG: cytochrome P460 family protein [Deltaproteobacteria bacterium]|nr:cytochrome P460 family protein [Deltaproteobacteria bacterium]